MGISYKGTEKQKLAMKTYSRMINALESIETWLQDEYRRYGLTENQFIIMENLYYSGPLTLSDVVEKIAKSEANPTQVIDSLEKSGFIERHRSTKDRRYVLLFLTKSGSEKIAQHSDNHVKSITSLLKVLSTEEQGELSALCSKIVAGIPEKHSSRTKTKDKSTQNLITRRIDKEE